MKLYIVMGSSTELSMVTKTISSFWPVKAFHSAFEADMFKAKLMEEVKKATDGLSELKRLDPNMTPFYFPAETKYLVAESIEFDSGCDSCEEEGN